MKLRIRLCTRLLLSITALLVIVVLAVSMVLAAQHRRAMLESARGRAVDRAIVLGERCRAEIVARDRAALDACLARWIDRHTLYLVVRDEEWEVIGLHAKKGLRVVAERRAVAVQAETHGASRRVAVPGVGSVLEVEVAVPRAGDEGGSPVGYVLAGVDPARADRAIAEFERRVLPISLLVAAVGAVVVVLLALGTLGRPIEELRAVTRRVAEGDFDVAIPIRSTDELGELAADFNRMTERLRDSREQLFAQSRLVKRKNDELVDAMQFLDSILRATSDHAIVAEDLGGTIVSANEGVRHIFGYDPDELGGDPVEKLLADADADRQPIAELHARALAGERDVSTEIRGRHRDGRSFPVHLSINARSGNSGECAGYVLIARDLTRELEERELVLRNRDLERSSRLKSEFLANMSHELRTPLNSVIGFSEVLLDGYFGELNDQQQEYVRDIHSSGRHLLDLINDILDLSKIEAGRMELHLESLRVREAIDRVVHMVATQADRKRIEVVIDVEPPDLVMQADPGRFKQMLLNLVSNAVKFTPDEGRVEILAGRDGDTVRFTVADTGIGIPRQYLSRVFDKFQQVEGGYRRNYGGTGLGLAIVKEFAELHGGRVTAQSEVDRGSRFTLILPAAAQTTAELPSGSNSDSAGEEAGGARAPGASPRDILVVGDTTAAGGAIPRALADVGRVHEARSGKEAIHRLRAARPALLALEVFLPDMDAFELLRILAEEPGLAGLPVVLLAVGAERDHGCFLGMDEYFLKPIPRTELMSRLEGFLLREPASSAPARVLVVDSNEKDLRLLESYLQPAGYDVTLARDASSAVERARLVDPGVVILDLRTPDESAFALVDRLREAGRGRSPLVFLTNGALTVDEKITLMEGAYAISAESPLDVAALRAEIERRLAVARDPGGPGALREAKEASG